MRTFGILTLALAVAFVGYQFAYPKLEEFLQLSDPALQNKAIISTGQRPPRPAEGGDATTTPRQETTMTPATPETQNPSAPATEPPVAATTNPSKTTGKEPGPDDFLPPTFPPLDEVVKGWKEIPKKVFPRQVKLLKDVEFKMSAGSSKIKAGSNATAIAQAGANLIVTPSENSPVQSQVALADTDLKESLAQAYESWKIKTLDWQRRQWEYRKTAASAPVTPVSSDPQPMGRADRPKRNSDGSYELLLASMKHGQVNEITPSNIKKWGELHLTNIGGKDYYTVNVNYTAKTMFGDFDTEAQARIINGRVEKWVYTGSGEVVP